MVHVMKPIQQAGVCRSTSQSQNTVVQPDSGAVPTLALFLGHVPVTDISTLRIKPCRCCTQWSRMTSGRSSRRTVQHSMCNWQLHAWSRTQVCGLPWPMWWLSWKSSSCSWSLASLCHTPSPTSTCAWAAWIQVSQCAKHVLCVIELFYSRLIRWCIGSI